MEVIAFLDYVPVLSQFAFELREKCGSLIDGNDP
jgi:hypothetical protein